MADNEVRYNPGQFPSTQEGWKNFHKDRFPLSKLFSRTRIVREPKVDASDPVAWQIAATIKARPRTSIVRVKRLLDNLVD
jgi:hypothetical protein